MLAARLGTSCFPNSIAVANVSPLRDMEHPKPTSEVTGQMSRPAVVGEA